MTTGTTMLKRALRHGGVATGLIKGDASTEPLPGYVPGYSASGQDIWLPTATHFGPGLVLSAVGARCGKVFLADGQWSVVANTVVLTPQGDNDPKFLWYLINHEDFWEKGGTAQPYVRVPETLARHIWLPPPAEQRVIADYLDIETARIDALITKKRRMIELLDERGRVVITSSVTRGLEQGVALRASGLGSVGQVPRHWGEAPLSSLCLFQPGKAHEPFIDEDGEFICVNSRFVSTEGRTVKRCTQNLSPTKKSDILMVMSDLPNGRALAKAFFVNDDQPYAVNQRVCIISSYGIHPKFAFYQLNRSPLLLRHDDGSNQTHLSNSAFTKFPLLVPPESEQAAIADHLDDLMADISAASKALVRQIDVLAEHRQAIITAAVTGERVLGISA